MSLPLLCASGAFPFLPFFDPVDLSSELFHIATPKNNARIVPVHTQDSSRSQVAVGNFGLPYHVEVYDVNTREPLSSCVGHRGSVFGLASVPCSSRVISGGANGTAQVLLFDCFSGRRLCSLPHPLDSTFCILSVPEWLPEAFVGGRATRGLERTLVRYDLTKQRILGALRGHSKAVHGLAANVSSNILYSSGLDKTVRMWSRDFQYGDSPQATLTLSNAALCLDCAEDKNLLLVGLTGGIVELWDGRQTRTKIKAIKVAKRPLFDLDRVDEDHFVSASADGTVQRWNLSTGVCNKTRELGGAFGVSVLRDRFGEEEEGTAGSERLAFLLTQGRDLCRIILMGAVVLRLKVWLSLLRSFEERRCT